MSAGMPCVCGHAWLYHETGPCEGDVWPEAVFGKFSKGTCSEFQEEGRERVEDKPRSPV